MRLGQAFSTARESRLGHLAGSWATAGVTAVALGFGTSVLGSDLHVGGMRIPMDVTLGIGLGLIGVQMKSNMLQTASAFVVGTALGRVGHEWFHGPPVSAPHAADHPAAAALGAGPAKAGFGYGIPHGYHGPHHGYGFGNGGALGTDPLVAAARYL